MKPSMFITGTDTGVGKTIITAFLMRFFLEKEHKTVTQKWIQTGCEMVSEDIKEHVDFACKDRVLSKEQNDKIAPYIFKFAASPHLAARMEETVITKAKIIRDYNDLARKFDVVLVEGSGGVLVPFNDKEIMIDLVRELSLPVLIVAGNRLGAINHTLLTIEALKKRNIPVLGILFNRISLDGNEIILKDNMDIVKRISNLPVFGELGYVSDREELYEQFVPIGEKILERSGKIKHVGAGHAPPLQFF